MTLSHSFSLSMRLLLRSGELAVTLIVILEIELDASIVKLLDVTAEVVAFSRKEALPRSSSLVSCDGLPPFDRATNRPRAD